MDREFLYTPEELSKMFRLSKYTIYEMIKRGELPAHRIGRSLRISEQQLETYLMRTGQGANTYDAVIEEENGQQFAVVDNVRLSVVTPLRGMVKISIQPEEIILSKGVFQSSARNSFAGTVVAVRQQDGYHTVVVDIGFEITAAVTKRSLEEMGIKIGDRIYTVFKTMAVKVVQ